MVSPPSLPTRNTPVSSISVTLSEATNPANFNDSSLSLTDDGGPNLITGAVTVTPITATTYLIGGLSGLTAAEGNYSLTVNAAGIQDQNGNPGTGTLSTSWLMDTTPPTSTVSPLAQTTTAASFTVSVTGSDPTGSNGSTPSGIASFAIYVSTDNGPYTLFATVTPANPSALFTGQPGHAYGFYSVATDNAGNVQPTPSAQATTEVVSPAVDTTMSLQSSEDPSKLGDSVTFTATVNPAQSTNGTPTGSAQFSIDGVAVGNPVPLDANGVATYTTSSLAVSSHAITASYINTDGNFNDSSATLSGGQTVTTADTTVAASSSAPTSVFGQSVTFTATVTPGTGTFDNGGTVQFAINGTSYGSPVSLSGGSATISDSALAASGTAYSVTAAYSGDTDFASSTGTLSGGQTVNPAILTITANNDSKTYGTNKTFSGTAFTENGLVTANGDTITGVNETSTGAPASATVGTYNIVPSAATGTGLGNYSIVYVNGMLTVNPATLTITANDLTKTYGDTVTFAGTAFTTTGLVNSDRVNSVTLTSPGAAATATVAGSPYAITPSVAVGTGVDNYSITYHAGSLMVNPASLTIVADNKTMSFGGPVPALTTSYVGFVNGDTPASLTTPVELATSATSNSQAGAYPITVGGASSPDYTINYLNGTLTVDPYVPPDRPRYQAAAAFVTTLYNQVLGRGPEPVGFKVWERRYLVGESPLRITQGFARSTERATLVKEGRAPSIPLRVVYNDALAAAGRAAR